MLTEEIKKEASAKSQQPMKTLSFKKASKEEQKTPMKPSESVKTRNQKNQPATAAST